MCVLPLKGPFSYNVRRSRNAQTPPVENGNLELLLSIQPYGWAFHNDTGPGALSATTLWVGIQPNISGLSHPRSHLYTVLGSITLI